MPPNTKGGAFVHDPNLAGSSQSQAVVKLRFANVNKQKMMVTRRLQVTKKKTGGGLTLKTLEGTLSFTNEKSDTAVRSSRAVPSLTHTAQDAIDQVSRVDR